VVPSSGKLSLTMEAELENIRGAARGGLTGTVQVDPSALEKSRGTLRFDLFRLSLVHTTRQDNSEEFGPYRQSTKQNDDMRTWLEIGDDSPEEKKNVYRYATFNIERVTYAVPNVVPTTAGVHPVELKFEGAFSLHGRSARRTVALRGSFHVQDQSIDKITIRTAAPLVVELESHDVRPRSAFGVLADRTLDAMGKKVERVAKISLELTLKPGTEGKEGSE
jgi:hypothetical protein